MCRSEFLAWAAIDVHVTTPALPLVTKKVGGIPEWTLAALGLCTVNGPRDDAIIDYKFWDSMQARTFPGQRR
jgi:hypothetical protein